MTSPNLLWREGQPTSTEFDDVYFSADNGLEESRYIFLQHNQLEERWQALRSSAPQQYGVFTIGETGFGTGLNFLAAWDLWKKTGLDDHNNHLNLHFISVEKYPLSRQDLTRALALWPELNELSQALIAAYPNFLSQGIHRLDFGNVKLSLIIDDAAAGFQQLLQPIANPDSTDIDFAPFGLGANRQTLGKGVDAWFLDGFAPAKNPSMWRNDVFTAIGQLSAPNATAATFTCARIAKDALLTAGFTFNKAPGFGRKREMLFAQRQPTEAVQTADDVVEPVPSIGTTHSTQTIIPTQTAAATRRRVGVTPWSQLPALEYKHSSPTVAVIGAGLAGCHTAYALAKRGWNVTVIDRRETVADGASGNIQGALFLRLSPVQETLAEFNLHAFLFAERFYRPLWSSESEQFGKACGLLQIANNDKVSRFQQRIVESFSHRADTRDLFQSLSAEQASEQAGMSLEKGGLFFPHSGWLSPKKLCEHLLSHPNISIKLGHHCDALDRDESSKQWVLKNKAGESQHQADIVILTGAHEIKQLHQTNHLPLKPVRGQVSHLTASSAVSNLKTVLTADGYLTPPSSAHGGMQSLGATFDIGETEEVESHSAHVKNAQLLNDFGFKISNANNDRALSIPLNSQSEGRTRIRCTTPDYLPLVGPTPIVDVFEDQYQDWRKNAKFSIPTAGAYYSNLYVNCGHGSRGLTYTPIAAELLAAMINGEPNPVGQPLSDALSAARFIVRNIKRGKR